MYVWYVLFVFLYILFLSFLIKDNDLFQEVRAKIKIIEQQQKTIEKLKAEEKRSCWKGKENVGMVHSTPLASPHKTLTPLRSRND